MPLATGTRLGPYEIVAPLGAGGMGEVYRARDSRLGREVAVKVLPEHLASDPEFRARFEREAKTISAFNDPHICVVHDVGRDGGTDYLVMELLEGETLASRLHRGPLPMSEVLRVGIQIAAALERAHRAGVVHRDLKPGNIMLTRAGAKLMDFGLARADGGRPVGLGSSAATIPSPAARAPLTIEGTIVGTFQYMAPEQLEGKEADARSDLWALGCVLYEMSTGARAFQGESEASLIAAIMEREPRAMAELQPMTPPALERVVRRCLQKSRGDRFQDAGDLGFVLRVIADGDVSSPAADGMARTASRAPWRPLLIGAVVLVLGAGVAFVAGRKSVRSSGGSLRVSPLSHGSRDAEPAVSPDGRLVAFSAVRPGGGGIWLMDMVTRSETRLTTGEDNQPRFSPDGASIFFTRRSSRGDFSLWRVPAIGGGPRLVIENASDADCSPDGSRLVYLVGIRDTSGLDLHVMTARVDGTGARELWTARSFFLNTPRWSPDGKQVAVIRSSTQNAPAAVVVVDAASGSSRTFPSPHLASLSSPCWDGTGRGLLVAEGENIVAIQIGGQGQLMRLDTNSGAYRPLGWLPDMPIVIDVLRDGRLVMSSSAYRQNLREVPITARSLGEGRWLTEGTATDRQPVYSPDGQWVMFSSDRGGTLDLWEVSTTTGELRRLTDDPADDWDPAFDADGTRIYWSSDRSKAFEIWTAHGDGSAPRQVSHDSLDAENPAGTPDGRWVVYSSGNPTKVGLWRVPSEGGTGERLTPVSTLIPDLSPDGRMVSVIAGTGTLAPELSVFDLEHRQTLPHAIPLRVSPPGALAMGRSRWTPDGKAIVFVTLDPQARYVLVRCPLAYWRTGQARVDTLFDASSQSVESFGISPDGRKLVVSVLEYLSGLTMAEGIKGVVPPRVAGGMSR